MNIDLIILSPQTTKGEGGKFNTQQLSWLRYCVDKVGLHDPQNKNNKKIYDSIQPFQKFQNIVKGSMQVLKQCWDQKPCIIKVDRPIYHGLMALPASLILGIPMAIYYRSAKETIIPKSWTKKIILKALMAWADFIVTSSNKSKYDLKKNLYNREILVIPGELPIHSNSSTSRLYSKHWQQFISTNQIHSDYWEEIIANWCQLLTSFCSNKKHQIKYLSNKKISEHSTKITHVNRMSHQALKAYGSKSMSPILNIAYYKKRELQKIIS
ncbi:MAG: hypothetical protein AAGD25_33565 [Cyanobacteria bacterium P01_F01_bin.150]